MKYLVAGVRSALGIALGLCTQWSIAAETPADAKGPTANAETSGVTSEAGFDSLPGQWVRPDGGYTITITSVDSDGKLDAAYANPSPLPFAQARASREGNTIKIFFELRAGGYNGSTYNLTYDAAHDVLRGVYYQAVAQQKFDVYFERVN